MTQQYLDLAQKVLDEGIVNAIKTTQSIKGILKSTKAMLKPTAAQMGDIRPKIEPMAMPVKAE